MIIKLMQPLQEEGGVIQNIFTTLDRIAFAFKQPLQPVFMVNIGGAILPCIGDYDAVIEKLSKHERFGVFDTLEGTKAIVNGQRVLFYVNPELGIFNLLFDGKAVLAVKATTEQVESLIEPHAVINVTSSEIAKKSSIIT